MAANATERPRDRVSRLGFDGWADSNRNRNPCRSRNVQHLGYEMDLLAFLITLLVSFVLYRAAFAHSACAGLASVGFLIASFSFSVILGYGGWLPL